MTPGRAAAAAALLAAGCSWPTGLAGSVTLDGRPLAGATVVLTPREPGAELVVGVTGPDGRFRVTPAAGPAIRPGGYAVTVSKRVPAARRKRALPVPPDPDFPGAADDPLALPEETLPPRYSDPKQTELAVTVPPAGEVRFDLTSR